MTSDLRTLAVAVFAAVLAAPGCSSAPPSGPKKAAEKSSAAKASTEIDEDKALLAVSAAIRKNHLVDDKPDQCLAYRVDGKAMKDAYLVEVRENHRHKECGGDPQTSPRLFSVKVVKATGAMSTDANSPSGEFRPLAK